MPSITALPALPAATGTDETAIVQGGVTYRGTVNQITLPVTNSLQPQITANAAAITTLQGNRVLRAGDTMTGLLTLSGAPTADLHAATRLFVNTGLGLRLALSGGTMTGILAMGTNRITGMGDPTAAQDGATQNYVDTTTAKTLQAYSPVATSAFPTTYGGAAITTGDRFNITAAGTMAAAAVTVQIGDIIEALVNTPGDVAANWAVYNANTFTASTTVSGISELATDAEAGLRTATDRVLTASNLASILPTGSGVGAYNAADPSAAPGLIETATAAEFNTGTDAIRAITPVVLNTAQADYQYFVGLQHVLAYSAGTWTRTRIAANDYVQRKTAAADTTIIGIDISPFIRTTASRGFMLNSFDVIHRNITADLVAHTVTLARVEYTDTGAVVPVAIPVTGTLPLTQNANLRVTAITVTTPVFNNNSITKYIIELTVNAALTSVYDLVGINLRFSKSGI